MKFSQLAVAAAVAGLANAQSQCLPLVTGIPACALGFIAEIAYSSFQCDIVDFACQCGHLNDLQVPVLNSIGTLSCDVGAVLNGASTLCSCATSNAPASVSLESYQKACEPSAVAIPGCALGYLASAGVADGCQINDFGCQCSNFNSIEAAIGSQVGAYCGSSSVQLTEVLASASSLCACVAASSPGGSPTAPAPVTSPTGESPAPTTTPASPTSPVTSGPSATTKPSSNPSGVTPPKSSPSGLKSQPIFTGAAVTASAFGGIFGVVAGLAALL